MIKSGNAPPATPVEASIPVESSKPSLPSRPWEPTPQPIQKNVPALPGILEFINNVKNIL